MIKRSTESHSDKYEYSYHRPAGRAIDLNSGETKKVIPIGSKKLLAIGGPRNMEMLPYIGMQEYVVPVLLPIKFESADEIRIDRSVPNMKSFRYYVQQIATQHAKKLVYVGEDLMSVHRAEELLKEALLEMWVEQPYKD